jgi:arabinofuranosyltransferase
MSIVALSGLFQSISNLDFYLDDAFIVLRYGRNLASGNGWVFNPGEHVNGCTSVLNTLFAALAHLISSDNPDRVMHILDDLFLVALALVMLQWLWREFSVLAGIVAASAILFDPLIHSAYGMETSLFLFLAGVCVWLHHKGSRVLGPCLGILVLARPDGIILAALILVRYLWLKKRIPWRDGLIMTAIVTCWLVFSWIYFGSPVPQSLSAKMAQGASGLWQSGIMFLPGLLNQVRELYPGWLRLLPIALLMLAGCAQAVRQKNALGLLFIWAVLHSIFYYLLGVPGYHWYYGPIFIGVDLLFALGAHEIFSYMTKLIGDARIMCGLAGTTLVVGLLTPFWLNIGKSFYLEMPPRERAYYEVGIWVRENTALEASLAAVELGTLGYYSERKVVDSLGLVSNPEMTDRLRVADYKGWLREYQPDLILIHQPIWPLEKILIEEPGMALNYRPLQTFDFPEYRTLVLIGKI